MNVKATKPRCTPTGAKRRSIAGGASTGPLRDRTLHDNNSREAEAIPHNRAALDLDLSGEVAAQCQAWLASSLHKTGRSAEALRHVERAYELADDAHLRRFLTVLDRRIRRRPTEE